MSASQLVHPDKDQLIAFGLGKLEIDEAAAIETHLNECSDCCDTLLNLKDDTFIGLLRESADQLTAPFGDGPAADPSGIPLELVDHPRYEISDLIGKGGMGLVFKAEHKLMNRTVALKVINQKLVRDEEAVRRFQREVQAAARLAHPNIVAAYDAEQAGNVHFLVMEYVDGVNLSEVIAPGKPLDIGTACDYIRQVADGLEHAHSKGMVHRDIKPHNLMVNADGQIKILDFGLATLAMAAGGETNSAPQQQQSSNVTTLGTMMGTPDFMSPEQAGGGRSVDIRSDIYSLGCTLYYLLTGRPPFNTGTAMERVKAHSNIEPEPIENIRKDVPAGLAAVIRRMMAKDSASRYDTPAEVADALAPFSAEAAHGQKQAMRVAPQTQASGRRRIPRAKMLIAAAFAGGLILAATIFYVQQGKTTIRFEVDDPSLAISFGTDTITIKDSGRELTIAPGKKQQFVIKQDGNELETDHFTLTKGQKVALKVSVEKGQVSVVPSDSSVPVDRTKQSVDEWVQRLQGLRDHMHTAFGVGPDLTLMEPEVGLEVVRKAWPRITQFEVKTGLLKTFAFSKALPNKHSKVLQVLDIGMNDNDPRVQSYAAAYIKDYAGKDFSNDPKGYAEWYAANRDKDPNELMKKNESDTTTGNGTADPAAAASLEGEQLWQQGKLVEATKKFQRAVQLDPKSTTALNGLGWSLFNSGHADDAIEAFEKCIAVDPNHPAALNGLGQIYTNRGDYKKAEEYLLKAAPEAPAAQFGLGRLYLLTGKYEEAHKWLEKVSEGAPADPILKQMLEAAKKRELPKGLKVRLQPMASNKNSKTSELNAQAWTQFFGHQYTAAEANFRKVLETSPEDPSAMNGLGFCLLNLGNAKEAKPYFEKLIANDPDAVGPLNGLARCLKAEGKVDEAIKTWEHGYKVDPSPNDIAGGLAAAYVETKQFAKAIPILEQLVKASPDNKHFQKLLASARKGVKGSEKAESEK